METEYQSLLSELCEANTQCRCHTLLYISMVNTQGHMVTGHVDLAERVTKVFISYIKSSFILHGIYSKITSSTGKKDLKTALGYFQLHLI